MGTALILVIFTVPTLVIALLFVSRITESQYDCKSLIENDLQSKGFKLIKSSRPGVFQQKSFEGVMLNILKMNALEVIKPRTIYRIVRYQNNKGISLQSWVKIELSSFGSGKTYWLPEL
jgi:hypothetical protein